MPGPAWSWLSRLLCPAPAAVSSELLQEKMRDTRRLLTGRRELAEELARPWELFYHTHSRARAPMQNLRVGRAGGPEEAGSRLRLQETAASLPAHQRPWLKGRGLQSRSLGVPPPGQAVLISAALTAEYRLFPGIQPNAKRGLLFSPSFLLRPASAHGTSVGTARAWPPCNAEPRRRKCDPRGSPGWNSWDTSRKGSRLGAAYARSPGKRRVPEYWLGGVGTTTAGGSLRLFRARGGDPNSHLLGKRGSTSQAL